jgi:acetylglutamate kinase
MTKYRFSELVEALPLILHYKDKVIVVKMGGSFIESLEGKAAFIEDVALLKLLGMKVIVVHGGGNEISARLSRLGLESIFQEGYRVTSVEAMDEVEMTLSGRIGKELVLKLNRCGVKAIGVSGKDGMLIEAQKKYLKHSATSLDLGQVGDVAKINPQMLQMFLENDYIPVVSPIGYDSLGNTYNINADSVAAGIAVHLKAEKLVLMTDVNGVYLDYPKEESFRSCLTSTACRLLLEDSSSLRGMGPKLECALQAVEQGVSCVNIINGSTKHSLLMEMMSNEAVGTQIVL